MAIALVAAALAVAPSTACESAVKHPAVTAGIVGGTLGFGTCKLASDSYGACLAVGAGAGAFLALVAAAAIWLGGDGNTVMVEEQAQPLPDERPRHKRPPPPADEPAAPPASEAPANPSPANPPTTTPPPANPPATTPPNSP
ncbi:MAG TPA: hypothetical protein VIX73_06950 [Kofleriaceae bacterium]